eukprot:1651809-Rhodomonas_salina.2
MRAKRQRCAYRRFQISLTVRSLTSNREQRLLVSSAHGIKTPSRVRSGRWAKMVKTLGPPSMLCQNRTSRHARKEESGADLSTERGCRRLWSTKRNVSTGSHIAQSARLHLRRALERRLLLRAGPELVCTQGGWERVGVGWVAVVENCWYCIAEAFQLTFARRTTMSACVLPAWLGSG